MNKPVGKKIILSVCSLILVTVSFLLDGKIFVQAQENEFNIAVLEKSDDSDFVQNNGDYEIDVKESRLAVKLNENSIIRFSPGTKASLAVNGNDSIKINLEKGRLWINTALSSLPVEIDTAMLKIEAEPGVFGIDYEESNVTVSSFKHSSIVEFLGKRLIVPESREMLVSESKLNNLKDTIAKLRYSKLIKEFPFFNISGNDQWEISNIEDDEEFESDYVKYFSAQLRSKGQVLPLNEESAVFKLDNFTDQAITALTLDPKKRARREVAKVIDYFDSAVYANFIGKNDAGENRLNMFKALVQQLDSDESTREELRAMLNKRLNSLSFARAEDKFFRAKSALRQVMYGNSLASLHWAFNDVLDTVEKNANREIQQKTLTALRQFGSSVESSFDNTQERELSGEIFFESVRMNDFLNRSPKLLAEEYLKISEIFERAHLGLLNDKEEEEDQKQFFISEKIRRIKAINTYMTKKQMAFQTARGSILFLVRQIEGLKPTFPTTAVLAYFEDQLAQMGDLVSFLRSASANNVRGSFEENFQEFQTSIDEMRAINDLLANSSGGTQISPFRREELASIVSNDFQTVGISEIRMELPNTEGDARVKITSSKFEGKTLSSVYDTARKVVNELEFNGEKITSAVRLENLRRFLLVKLGRVVLPSGISSESLTEAPSQQSMLERVAKATLMEELERNNISVEERYLGFENLSDGIIHVRLAHIGEEADIKVFSFDILQRGNVVSNLRVQTVSGEIPVNDSFALRELPIKVEQIYQRALFEKQRAEELERYAVEGTVRDIGSSTTGSSTAGSSS